MSSPLGIHLAGKAWRKMVIIVCQIVTLSSGRVLTFFSGLSELEAHSSHTLSEG